MMKFLTICSFLIGVNFGKCEKQVIYLDDICVGAFLFECSGLISTPNAEFHSKLYDRYRDSNVQSFSSFTSDMTVTVTDSNFEIIPDIYIGLRSLQMRNCGITYFDRSNFDYMANTLKHLDISSNKIREITGESFGFLRMLEQLDLRNNLIYKLDWNSFNELSELGHLNLKNNEIDSLSVNIFGNLTSLLFVDLSYNQIEYVPNNIFQNNTFLKIVNFSNNRLKKLNLFQISVERLDGSSNFITEFPTIFNRSNLKWLNLSNNQIKNTRYENNLTNAVNLKDLLLGNNKITDLAFLKNFYNLERLDISNNKFPKVCKDDLEKLVKLSKLNFSGNSIETVDENTFANFNGLTYLKIDNNKIQDFRFLSPLHKLELLDISQNKVGRIGVDFFSNMSELQSLNLSSASVTGLNYGTFSHQSKLIELDLSYNNLYDINLDILTPLKSLKRIYLNGNKLKHIDAGHLLTVHRDLQEIGLVDNDWTCSYLSNLTTYLQLFEINLRVKPHEIVKNETNLSGVRCKNDEGISPGHKTQSHSMPNGNEQQIVSSPNLDKLTSSIKLIGIFQVILIGVFLILYAVKNVKECRWRGYNQRGFQSARSNVELMDENSL